MRIEQQAGESLKDAKLDDNASIYARREELTERQKLKEMDKKERWQYFKEYYFVKLILICAAAFAVCYVVYTMVKPRIETVFYAAIMYDIIPEENRDGFISDLETLLDVDTEKQNVFIDDNYLTEMGTGMSGMERIQTYMYAGQVDVLIADRETFGTLTKAGCFLDLAELFPTETYSKLSSTVYTGKSEEDNRERAYGFYLTDCEKYRELGVTMKEPVIGIVANTKYKDNAVKVIDYLFK